MSSPDHFKIHTDGGARGNPGPAAYAFVIERPGGSDVEEAGVLGHTTNNVAEYTALIRALEKARGLGGRKLHIYSDSELMVKQMRGEYKVKHEGLLPLYQEARKLCRDFEAVIFEHVRREQNKRADELYNRALDGDTKPKAAPAKKSPARAKALDASAREDVLECLRSAACAWSAGNPNQPRAEEVWEQLWFILEEAGVVKTARPE